MPSTPLPQTFAEVLARQLRHDPGRPLITFYDHGSGERVELSVTTYANWVAKAASLLVEEHDLERGMRLHLDLPTHWLGPVFLGAAWAAGLVVSDAGRTGDADAVVCGPAGLARWAPSAGSRPVLGCSLLPLGVRFADRLPVGVHDVGVEIWSQPDSFIPWDPPVGDDPAIEFGGASQTQAEMWEAAAARGILLVAEGGRLLSAANPASPPGLAAFTEPLVRSGSLVLVTRTDRQQLESTYVAERATARFAAV